MSDTTGTAFPLSFERTPSESARAEAEREAILADPGFGKHFTDHMVHIDWTLDAGWHDARVVPYGPLQLDPAASVLHYAQEIFEGMKAYRHADGSVWTFRPERNAARLQRSARRLALPELPTEDFVESVRQLVRADLGWVPSAPEQSLYLRPFMIANESFLGVRAAQRVGYYVIAGRARRRPAATTRRRSCRRPRPRPTAAPRCCSSTPRRARTSRSSAA
jgi:branched-chain amino acid aminotransferase